MAHIKVVRRSMRPEEWTDLRFGWLKRHIYSKKWEINNLMIRDARQVSEMEFEYYSDEYRPLKKGDMYLGIKGEKINGNNYIEQAFINGAIGCITDENVNEEIINKQNKK